MIAFLLSLFLAVESAPEVVQPVVEQEKIHVILDPINRTDLSTRLVLKVIKINKRMGDHFRQGDILIELEKELLESAYAKAEAAVEKGETRFKSKNALFKDHAASQTELSDAKADLASAKSDLSTAKENLSQATLIAPYDGKVVDLFIEENEMTKEGQPLIEIIDDSILKAKFLAKSSFAVKVGDSLKIKLDESGEIIEAKITRVSPSIDPSSGTVKAEAVIDNQDGKLHAGMSGEATL